MLCPLMQIYVVHAPLVFSFTASHLPENAPFKEEEYFQKDYKQCSSDAENDAFTVLRALRGVLQFIWNLFKRLFSPFCEAQSILSERIHPVDRHPKAFSSLKNGRLREELELPSREATELVSAVNQGYIHKKCEGADFSKMTESEASDFVEKHLHDVPSPLPASRPKLTQKLARERRLKISPAPRRPKEDIAEGVSTEFSYDRHKGGHPKGRMNVNVL